jgi:chaperone modulatory protein CbpM
MTQEHIALLLDDACLTLDDLAASCTVSREWIIEHVQAGALPADPSSDPAQWFFTGRDLLRTRRLFNLERSFDANPELAGLVADLVDELQRLRTRLLRAGISPD